MLMAVANPEATANSGLWTAIASRTGSPACARGSRLMTDFMGAPLPVRIPDPELHPEQRPHILGQIGEKEATRSWSHATTQRALFWQLRPIFCSSGTLGTRNIAVI